MTAITAEKLREILDYDPETGVFTWRVTLSIRAPSGSTAGTCCNDGRVNITICGRRYKAHRLAWLYVHGEWPPELIDHIDGNPSNNRIANLRPATCRQNGANAKRSVSNTSGFKGVCWDGVNRRWRAHITLNGKTKCLGRFDKIEDASAAYRKAAERCFGEFARTA
jgi:hypothetical protein